MSANYKRIDFAESQHALRLCWRTFFYAWFHRRWLLKAR